jgi:hypothetical protein
MTVVILIQHADINHVGKSTMDIFSCATIEEKSRD